MQFVDKGQERERVASLTNKVCGQLTFSFRNLNSGDGKGKMGYIERHEFGHITRWDEM